MHIAGLLVLKNLKTCKLTITIIFNPIKCISHNHTKLTEIFPLSYD